MRPATRGEERLREAAKLGFSIAVVPKANAPKGASSAGAPKGAAAKGLEGLTIHPVERIEEAIDLVRTL